MAYEIHIERQTSPITLGEWHGAINRTEAVRMVDGAQTITNPKTGEVISVANEGGDAEVFFPADRAWRRVFRWSRRGAISFVPPTDFAQPYSHLRRIASTLTQTLGASLTGDAGETYD